MNTYNLGAPQVGAPELAYRRPDAYRDGDLAPRNDDLSYRDYEFIGRMPLEAHDAQSAQKAARAKFDNKRAKVFRTAKYWVAYVIR